MTTDHELLARIDVRLNYWNGLVEHWFQFKDTTNRATYESAVETRNMFAALRAVVELHKPKDSIWKQGSMCEECGLLSETETDYPCSTIQAIEKELG